MLSLGFVVSKNLSQLFGGGPLSKEVGDAMVDKGVSLFNLYGAYVSSLAL